MRKKSDPRHTARKLALASLFCWMFTEPSSAECLAISKEVLDTDNADFDTELVNSIVEGVKTHIDDIDNIIRECAPEWPLDKIAKVDLVILRIAIYEVVFGTKVPMKVAIDESVEIAKEFGNDTSHKFINGVLGTVVDKYSKDKDR
jgi:N utilization substance protein B